MIMLGSWIAMGLAGLLMVTFWASQQTNQSASKVFSFALVAALLGPIAFIGAIYLIITEEFFS